MSGEILINYDEVYRKTAEMCRNIETELREMDTAYRHVGSMLNRVVDGKTNAVFAQAMEVNQQKARVTAETLHKLLNFMETSARQVERAEGMHTRAFNLSRITRS